MKKTTRFLTALLVPLLSPQVLVADQVCKYASIPASAPAERFEPSSDGTLMTDTATGLQWKRCSEGQAWDGSSCTGTAGLYTWPQALGLVPSGWRVPNVKELSSLLEDACVNPAIDSVAFPATPAKWFWSSSPYAALEGGIWGVDFYDGYDGFDLDFSMSHLRLVRDGG